MLYYFSNKWLYSTHAVSLIVNQYSILRVHRNCCFLPTNGLCFVGSHCMITDLLWWGVQNHYGFTECGSSQNPMDSRLAHSAKPLWFIAIQTKSITAKTFEQNLLLHTTCSITVRLSVILSLCSSELLFSPNGRPELCRQSLHNYVFHMFRCWESLWLHWVC
jgi:hypothetical protein